MIDGTGHAVRFQPVLPLAAALGVGQAPVPRPFPLGQPRLLLTFSGTAAVYQAFRALALPPGSTVLCPSYNCGHEIEPLIRLGLRVRCYRIGADLEVDLTEVERRMSRDVRALMVTHFFGFGQRLEEVRALCDRRGVRLVEDCAHALLSDNPSGNLGRLGDVSIYSMRKTLPLPNGGAVLFNDPAVPIPEALEAPPRLTTWLKALDLARKSAVDRVLRDGSWLDILPMAALAPLVGGSELLVRLHPAAATSCYDPDDDDFGFDSRILAWSISSYSRGLLDRLDGSGIAARRRYNYRYLADGLRGLAGCRMLRPELGDHTCPLFLPILAHRRAEVFQHLVRHRIYPAIWWDQRHPAVDWSEFPEAGDLKDRVLALPVHQDVDDEQLEYLLSTMRRCPSSTEAA
jgi:dTDP-4-amino-4,6-dideoxygalactose transaminase